MTSFYSSNDRLLSTIPTAPRAEPGGWIYILMTRSDGNRVKIGKTKNNPIERLAKLRCGDPYMAMVGSFYIPESMGEIKHIEKWVHDWFESCRIRFAEHIRPHGNRPAHTLDDDTLIAYSEWFKIDVLEASGHLKAALQECLEVDDIHLASWSPAGAYPVGLAYYNQEMLTEMFGRPVNVDDDYELGDKLDGHISW